MFEVKSVTKLQYNGNDKLSTDYALLELKTAAHGFDYVRPPSQVSASLKDFIALVVNQPSDSTKVFQWKALIVRPTQINFRMFRFPAIWGTKKCKLGGNSGGSIYAQGICARS